MKEKLDSDYNTDGKNNIISAGAFSIVQMLSVDIENSNSDDLNKNNYYYVPSYQRNYDWEPKIQTKKLLDDLINFWIFSKNDYSKSFFIGNIVVKKSKERENEYCIIDGQQRITTFFLMICSIYRIIRENNSSSKSLIDLKKMILINNDENSLRLNNKISLNKLTIVKDNAIYDNDLSDDGNNYEKNYLFFYKTIKKNLKIEDWLEIIKRIKIAMIKLGENDDEVSIFELINSTGLELNVSDLIRSYLYLITEKFNFNLEDKNKIDVLFSEGFEENFISKNKNGESWDLKNLNRFVAAIIQILTKGHDPGKRRDELYLNFKKHVSKEIDRYNQKYIYGNENEKQKAREGAKKSFNNLIKFLKDCNRIYKDIHDDEKISNIENLSKQFILKYKNDLYLSLIIKLSLMKESNEIGDVQENEIYELLDMHNLNITITQKNQNINKDNKFLAGYLKKVNFKIEKETLFNYLKGSGDNKSNFYEVKKFKESFENVNFYDDFNTYAKYILFRIENNLSEKLEHNEYIEMDKKWTLEHLLPQKYKQYWDEKTYDEDELEAKLHSISNLTIVKHKLNNKMNNKPWCGNENKEYYLKRSKLEINKKIIEITSCPTGWTLKKEPNSSHIKWINFLWENLYKIWNLSILNNYKRWTKEERISYIENKMNDLSSEKFSLSEFIELIFVFVGNEWMKPNIIRNKYLSMKWNLCRNKESQACINFENIFDFEMNMIDKNGAFIKEELMKQIDKNKIFIFDSETKEFKLSQNIYENHKK